MSALLELAARVEAEQGTCNALDIEVEIALFEPDADYVAIRPNAANTKTICTCADGTERTFWARDFTMSKSARWKTAAALRARAALETGDAS